MLRLFCLTFFWVSGLCSAQQSKPQIVKDSVVNRMVAERILINQQKFQRHYFTIQLFNGGHQAAKEIQILAEEKFPDLPSFFTFETPNYKVQLGRFKFKGQAKKVLLQVKKEFPESFLIEQQ